MHFSNQALAQQKILLGEGEHKFSVNYTFYQESLREYIGSKRIIKRNRFGLQERYFTVDGQDTNTMYCREYNNRGLITAQYQIARSGKVNFSSIYEYHSNGNMLKSIESGSEKIYNYYPDSNIVLVFRPNYRQDTMYLIEKKILNANRSVAKMYAFGYKGKIISTTSYTYLDNGRIIKEIETPNQRYKSILVILAPNTLLLRINEYPDGKKDTVMNRLPKKVLQKPLISAEYQHYNYGGHPDYDIETFPNGLTSKIQFYAGQMRDPSHVYYTLNTMDKHEARYIYETVNKYDWRQYVFIDVNTGEKQLIGKRQEIDEEVDISITDEELDVLRKMPTRYKEPTQVYHLGDIEIDTIGFDEIFGHQLAYRSYIGVTKFEYDSQGNLISEKIVEGGGDNIQYAYDQNGNMNKKVTGRSVGFKKVERFKYENANKLSHHSTYFYHDDSMTRMDSFEYDINGNRTYYLSQGHWVKERYNNTLQFAHLGNGLAHELRFEVLESGIWNLQLKSSTKNFTLQLLTLHGKVINPKANNNYTLEKGVYTLRIAAQRKSGDGIYDLVIRKEQ